MNSHIDELLDIVNSDDQVIGTKYRSEIYAQKANNFRVVNAFVVNSSNQIWIPRRSPFKKLFPSCLDASVGGHVMAGETYEIAFAREAQEELNIDVSQFQQRLLTHLNPHQQTVSAHMHLYVIFSDQDPIYNKNDFISARWYTISELQELIQSKESMKSDLPTLVNSLQSYLF